MVNFICFAHEFIVHYRPNHIKFCVYFSSPQSLFVHLNATASKHGLPQTGAKCINKKGIKRRQKLIETYMSITSLIRTLIATSVDGFPLLLPSLVDTVMTLVFGEEASEQTAAITSCTSAGFNRRGCCSLVSTMRTYSEV